MKGLILVNAYAKTTETRQVVRMREELTRRGVTVDTLRNDQHFARITNNIVEEEEFKKYDFCLYLDKDKYVPRVLSKRMRLFNSASAIEYCDDKMITHLMLANHGIIMPDTLAGFLCYDRSAEIREDSVSCVMAYLGLPVIVKQAYGSMGTGVYKADTKDRLKALMEKFKCEPHLFQQYIGSSCGKDLRVIVVGGKVLGGIERSSDTDFRSNVGLGGHAKRADVPTEVEKTAIKAAEILGLDYCGIDFLYGEKTYMLCEVNSNAFFDAFEAATGINVAGAYAEHIINNIDISN
ncbi:MAG: RimK family alpha-L-glutamate ligase [Clostridiales bacterium]|nr:RimK family alpha-L-glutamate ligase [Clostridiales bacterium]